MSGYFALDPRSLTPEDAQGTRVLLMGALGVTPYIDRALEVLELAERGNDAEHRAPSSGWSCSRLSSCLP